jgi:3-hydroxyacyl-CoA dehydrogenase
MRLTFAREDVRVGGKVSQGLRVEDKGFVRLLTIATPPSNSLTPGLRAALVSAIETAPAHVERIVLAAGGATFSSGLPLEPDRADPDLARLCRVVEAARVPVIAALHGLVLGPGAELALAARARTAAPGTRIAFAEIALGLCCEGGTTRRLACRTGIATALRLMLSGRAVGAQEALQMRLIDAVADDPVAAAHSLMLGGDVPMVPRADARAVAEVRRTRTGALPAAGRIIACVEAAALLPPDAHQSFETVAREDLEAGPEAAALCAVALAERRAASLPTALARVRATAPDRIGLVGDGVPEMITLARIALARGLEVVWHHPDPTGAAASLAALDRAEASEQRAGRLSAAARAAGRTRLRDHGEAPLWIHASQPTEPVRAGAAQAVLGDGGPHPGLTLAPMGLCCEISVPADCQPEGPALVLATLRRLGLQPVLVGQRPILGQGLMTAGHAALAAMATAGVPKERIAAALQTFGAPRPDRLPEPERAGPALSDDQILSRWLGALANEGLRLLAQGIALRASDMDLVLVTGYGFPRWRGGPMHLADRRGLMALRADLRRWEDDSPLWRPAPLLDRLIRDGEGLYSLNWRG